MHTQTQTHLISEEKDLVSKAIEIVTAELKTIEDTFSDQDKTQPDVAEKIKLTLLQNLIDHALALHEKHGIRFTHLALAIYKLFDHQSSISFLSKIIDQAKTEFQNQSFGEYTFYSITDTILSISNNEDSQENKQILSSIEQSLSSLKNSNNPGRTNLDFLLNLVINCFHICNIFEGTNHSCSQAVIRFTGNLLNYIFSNLSESDANEFLSKMIYNLCTKKLYSILENLILDGDNLIHDVTPSFIHKIPSSNDHPFIVLSKIIIETFSLKTINYHPSQPKIINLINSIRMSVALDLFSQTELNELENKALIYLRAKDKVLPKNDENDSELQEFLKEVEREIDMPNFIGFLNSRPEIIKHYTAAHQLLEGSFLNNIFNQSQSKESKVNELKGSIELFRSEIALNFKTMQERKSLIDTKDGVRYKTNSIEIDFNSHSILYHKMIYSDFFIANNFDLKQKSNTLFTLTINIDKEIEVENAASLFNDLYQFLEDACKITNTDSKQPTPTTPTTPKNDTKEKEDKNQKSNSSNSSFGKNPNQYYQDHQEKPKADKNKNKKKNNGKKKKKNTQTTTTSSQKLNPPKQQKNTHQPNPTYTMLTQSQTTQSEIVYVDEDKKIDYKVDQLSNSSSLNYTTNQNSSNQQSVFTFPSDFSKNVEQLKYVYELNVKLNAQQENCPFAQYYAMFQLVELLQVIFKDDVNFRNIINIDLMSEVRENLKPSFICSGKTSSISEFNTLFSGFRTAILANIKLLLDGWNMKTVPLGLISMSEYHDKKKNENKISVIPNSQFASKRDKKTECLLQYMNFYMQYLDHKKIMSTMTDDQPEKQYHLAQLKYLITVMDHFITQIYKNLNDTSLFELSRVRNILSHVTIEDGKKELRDLSKDEELLTSPELEKALADFKERAASTEKTAKLKNNY